MTVKLGIVMDPISSINIKKDSSFAMLEAAQARGWELYYLEMQDLLLKEGRAQGNMARLTVERNPENWFALEPAELKPLADLDVILMRKDPPFDTEYIYATYLLEQAEAEGTLIVNKPQSLRDCNEKLFTAWFPDLTPPTLVSRSKGQFREFLAEHQDVIVKILDGMGGASIFRIQENDPNISVIIETLTEHGQRFAMAQKFLPEILEGDKRILIIDGEVVPWSLARIPAQGETRGNLAAGGRGEARPLNETDLALANQIAPTLKRKGLIFVGLDVIGDRVTEINVTSPTCIREISEASGIDVAGQLMDAIAARLAQSDAG